jgi:uncharacterized protein (TIGR00369 family)
MEQVAAPKLTRKELEDHLEVEFPELFQVLSGFDIEEMRYGGCRLRRRFDPQLLRPGGTIAGTTIMALADYAMYFAVLGAIGWVPLAVTTNLTINFLKKPAARDLLADARLLKLGKRLAVGEIGIFSAGDDELVAHATSTYSIPSVGRVGNKIPLTQASGNL